MDLTLDRSDIFEQQALFDNTVSGKPWRLNEIKERDILSLTQRYPVSSFLARVLLSRGIAIEHADQYLAPSLRHSLPDPFSLKDMDKAVARIELALEKGERIGILGDFDVDGATSSAVLYRYLQAIGLPCVIYIPDRLKEGYGPNSPAIEYLKAQGVSVLLTLDCGTVSYEPLQHAFGLGLDVIVVDHHLGGETLPMACAVINPNRMDETTIHTYLAAVGVTFLLCVGLNKALREKGYFKGRQEPDLLSLLDLVALGTVCDVMPLKGLNRSYVAQGLKIMAKRQNLGLRVLGDVAGIDSAPSVYHLGFMLGPRINAGGRVGKSDMGARLLTTTQETEAYELAAELNRLNEERKSIEDQVLQEATAKAECIFLGGMPPAALVIAGEGWHPGVIGIVAGRLKDAYECPSVVIALKEGVGKASARSVSGVDIGTLIALAKQQGILVAGGGHPMAGGLTIEEKNIAAFTAFLESHCRNAVETYRRERFLALDGVLTVRGATIELAKELAQAAPFGIHNPSPRFALVKAYVASIDIIGGQHIRCFLGDHQSMGRGGKIKAMAFRSVGTPLGDALLQAKGQVIHAAGHLQVNQWQGKESLEFLLEDIKWI